MLLRLTTPQYPVCLLSNPSPLPKRRTSTSVFGDGRISTHADPYPASTRCAIFHERRIRRIGQRAGHADSSDFGLLGEQIPQNVKFPALDADEPPYKI